MCSTRHPCRSSRQPTTARRCWQWPLPSTSLGKPPLSGAAALPEPRYSKIKKSFKKKVALQSASLRLRSLLCVQCNSEPARTQGLSGAGSNPWMELAAVRKKGHACCSVQPYTYRLTSGFLHMIHQHTKRCKSSEPCFGAVPKDTAMLENLRGIRDRLGEDIRNKCLP